MHELQHQSFRRNHRHEGGKLGCFVLELVDGVAVRSEGGYEFQLITAAVPNAIHLLLLQ